MSESELLRPRKLPRQTRSRHTVEAILSATGRVLVEEGYDRASTNRIAEVAGVSVGSLYQYFPNKQSLVGALIEQHAARMLLVLADCEAAAGDGLEGAITRYVDALAGAHAVAPPLLRALVRQAPLLGDSLAKRLDARAHEIVAAAIERFAAEVLPSDRALAARLVVTTTRAVLEEASFDAGRAPTALREELVRLVVRYLRSR